jgi:hypothetical protein
MAMLDQQGSGPPGPPSADPSGPHPLISGMTALHDMTRAKYDKLAEAKGLLEKVKKELLPLAKMGDTVSQDDVIKAAGKIVGHGLGAGAVAGLLADMPQDGQPLAAWVAQHLLGIQQREQQLAPVLTGIQHELGVHSLQLLAAHSIHGKPQASDTGGNNPLTQPSASQAGAAPGEASASEASGSAPAEANPLGATGPGPGGPSNAA